MTITEEDVDTALTWLRDKAGAAAQAKAERIYLEQYIKTVKATVQSACIATGNHSVASAEAAALMSQEYADVLAAYKEAVRVDEKYRFLREAEFARVEAWRTQCSNERASRV